MEKFIISNGCALRIADSRKGEKTILLLHGYLESLDVWEDFAKLLSNEYRVLPRIATCFTSTDMTSDSHSRSLTTGWTHTAIRLCSERPSEAT